MCTISDLRIQGFDVGPTGRPTRYVVTCAVVDCKTVRITVRSGDATGPLIHQSGDVQTAPAGPGGAFLVRHEFATLAAHDVECGRTIWVRIECTEPPECSVEELVEVECPELTGPDVPDLDPPPPGDEDVDVGPPVTEPDPRLPPTTGFALPNPLCRPLRQMLAVCLALLIVCTVAAFSPIYAPVVVPIGVVLLVAIGLILGLMLLLLCRPRGCARWRVIAWAGKWATVILAPMSLIGLIITLWLALPMIIANLVVGISTGILILWMDDQNCAEPQARGWP